jgi:hypothetical protein
MTTPILVDRKTAAQMLGISIEMVKLEQAAGRLKAKNTRINDKGRATGKTLYAVADLQAWADSLRSA